MKILVITNEQLSGRTTNIKFEQLKKNCGQAHACNG